MLGELLIAVGWQAFDYRGFSSIEKGLIFRSKVKMSELCVDLHFGSYQLTNLSSTCSTFKTTGVDQSLVKN